MLRTNLSTRPFYNERSVQMLLGIAALLIILLTAFNAIRIVALSQQNTELSSLINRDREEAQRLSGEAARIRAGINREELQATAAAASTANRLIDQRTFSWTEFFNRIESTLPPDVMLTAVQPSFTEKATVIQMVVLGRRTEDIDEFMAKLEATRAFSNVLPLQEDRTEEGLHRVSLRTVYRGAAGAASGTADASLADVDTSAPEASEPSAVESPAPDLPAPAGETAQPDTSGSAREGRGQ